MTKLINEDDEFVTCENCDANFQVIWTRNIWIIDIEYCPFCGDEVERDYEV